MKDNLVKEKLTRKIRRKLLELIVPYSTRVRMLNEAWGGIYDLVVGDEFGPHCNLLIVGSYLAVLDVNEDEDVMALVGIDVLGKQGILFSDDSHDIVGIGRAVKKLLESRGYHVYYQIMPMAYRNGVVAVGPKSVGQFASVSSTSSTTRIKEVPNAYKH